MTRATYDALVELLSDLHDTMADEVPSPVRESVFKHLGLAREERDDDNLLILHSILYALYGFRPGRQTIAESYAQRHLDKTTGELREYLGAICGVRFSIFRILNTLPSMEAGQVRLYDELDPPNVYVVWFDLLAKVHKEKSVAGLLCVGYVVPIHGGHMHIGMVLTASEELLAEAIRRKTELGRKPSAQADLIKYITRRALHEEMEVRDNAAARGEEEWDEDE